MTTPIKLTIYDENDEIKKEYTRTIVKHGLSKKAMRLMAEINALTDDGNVPPKPRKRPPNGWRGFVLRAWQKFFPEPYDETSDERSVTLMEDFIIDFFGDGLRRKDLENSEFGELMAVLVAVMQRVNESAAKYPTFPQGGRRKGRR